MEDSIFTKIIKGEIPCHKVYEDERTIAFMDIHPIQPGHIVVASKTQIPFVYDLDDADATAFWKTCRLIAKRLRKAFPEKKRIAMLIEGLDVAHAHANLFPIDDGNDTRRHVDKDAEPDHEALAALAKKLAL